MIDFILALNLYHLITHNSHPIDLYCMHDCPYTLGSLGILKMGKYISNYVVLGITINPVK